MRAGIAILLLLAAAPVVQAAPRATIPLDGRWQVRIDPADAESAAALERKRAIIAAAMERARLKKEQESK